MADQTTFSPLQPGRLRPAVAAAGRLAAAEPIAADLPHVDRVSAEALADTLAHFAELPDWSSATLAEVTAAGTQDPRLNCMCKARP